MGYNHPQGDVGEQSWSRAGAESLAGSSGFPDQAGPGGTVWRSRLDSSVLSSALDTIRGTEGVEVTSLTDEESQALAAFLSEKSAESQQSEADQLLCRHIRIVLQERAARARKNGDDPSFQRSNLALRAVIDLFMAQDYSAVLQKDVTLLRDTRTRLEALVATDLSPNHVRLSNLIAACLAAYDDWTSKQLAGNDAPAPPVTPVQPAPEKSPLTPGSVRTAEAREFLSHAGMRETLQAIEGVPLAASLRVLKHDGALCLNGELSEEFLLDIQGGGLEIQGGVSGFVVADGDITVHGSVQGGWLFSRKGNIQAGRILAGSVLIAPQGGITTGGTESPRLIYCGLDYTTDQGVRSGIYFTRDFRSGEGIRNARIHVRGTITAPSIEQDANDDAAGIQFRIAQTCHDFGRPIEESVAGALRNFARLRYRKRIAAALQVYLERELLALHRLRIFAVQSGAADATAVAPIRAAQGELALLGVLLETGEGLKEIMVLGENTGQGMESALLSVGIEESTACLGTLAREIKMMCRGYVRDKEALEAPSRHIASFAKKLKDTLRLGQGPDKLIYDFDFRMDEWRAQAAQAAEALAAHEETMAKMIGPTVWQVEDTDRLGALVARMIQSAEENGKLPRVLSAREMGALREHAEQHTGNRKAWRESLATLEQEFARSLKALEETTALAVAEGGEQEVRAAHFGPGVRIQTLASIKRISGSSGAMVLVTGGPAGSPEVVRMRNLRLYPDGKGA